MTKRTKKRSTKNKEKPQTNEAVGDDERQDRYDIIYHEIQPKLESLPGLKDILNQRHADGWSVAHVVKNNHSIAILLERPSSIKTHEHSN